MSNEILVFNIEENRTATKEEITRLIETGRLFINSYIIGDKIGRVFVDLAMYGTNAFVLQPANENMEIATSDLLTACKALIRCKDNDLSGAEFIRALVGVELAVQKAEGR